MIEVISTAALPSSFMRPRRRQHAWRQWLLAQGVTSAKDLEGPRFELFSMAVQAAVHSLGAALVPAYVAANELKTRALVAPLRQTWPSGLGATTASTPKSPSPPNCSRGSAND